MKRRWVCKEIDKKEIEDIQKELGIPYLPALILYSRGLKDKEKIDIFLQKNYSVLLEHLHSPWKFSDMKKAVARLIIAREKREKILIYGDYDVDGITGTALLVKVLRKLGFYVDFYIPHRLKEGYGLSIDGVKFAKENGFSLIVTNDCGITAVKEVEFANENKIDVIILDHHEPKDTLPPAYAILNPKLDKNYPFRELAGVGVALKLLYALIETTGYNPKSVYNHLDMVALGTIADVVPLIDENRIIAKVGLALLRKGRNENLRILSMVAGIKPSNITPYHISFILGPRLNASGRISDAVKGVELLISKSKDEIIRLAQELEKLNRRRKNIEDEVLRDARIKVERKLKESARYVIVLGNEGWHEGVIGIVASKISEEFYRPAIILSFKEDVAKGSARSIPDFSIYEALKFCEEVLLSFGGHEGAAGVLLERNLVDELERLLNIYASKLPKEIFVPKLRIDAYVSLKDVTKEAFDILKDFSPFGVGNPEPVFAIRGAEVVGYPRVIKERHLKFTVRQGDHHVPAILPEGAELITEIETGKKDHLDIAFKVTEDNFWGKNTLILQVEDIRLR